MALLLKPIHFILPCRGAATLIFVEYIVYAVILFTKSYRFGDFSFFIKRILHNMVTT